MSPTDTPGITLDTSTWPLVVVTFHREPTDDDIHAMFAAYEGCYARAEPFHVVNDGLRIATAPNAAQRRLIADKAREHGPMSRQWVVGSATVVENPVMRGVVTALNWLTAPAYAHTICATLPEAIQVAVRALGERGIQLSAQLHRYQRKVELAARG